jgi:hypothetical protein
LAKLVDTTSEWLVDIKGEQPIDTTGEQHVDDLITRIKHVVLGDWFWGWNLDF